MVNLTNEATKAICESLPETAPVKDVLEALFKKNLVDTKLLKIGLIRKFYFKMLQSNQDLKPIDAKELVAEDFGVSVSFVEKAIYKYRKVEV